MRRSLRGVGIGLGLASLMAAALAQQGGRNLSRLSIAGSFAPSWSEDRSELRLVAGKGPLAGILIVPPDGGSLSVEREPIEGGKARLVVRFAAPGREPSHEPPPPPRPGEAGASMPASAPSAAPPGGPTASDQPVQASSEKYGGGWLSKGGHGCPRGKCGDVYEVTTLANAGPGSLRAGIESRPGPRVIRFKVAGVISVLAPMNIRLPYLTLDGASAPAPGITIKQGNCQQRSLAIIATHDVEYSGLRFEGCFEAGVNGGRNFEMVQTDGAGKAAVVPWDDEPPSARNRRIYRHHNTYVRAEDDAGSTWCGAGNPDQQAPAEGVTNQAELYLGNFHPLTTGCNGWKAPGDPKARFNVSIVNNVCFGNGERCPAVFREGCYNCDAAGNVAGDWQNFSGRAPRWCGPNGNEPCGDGGYGLMVRDFPNSGLNVVDNVFLPGRWRPDWDCVWGRDPAAPTGDPRQAEQHYSGNLFSPLHNPKHCVSTAGGEQPFKRSYPLPRLDVHDPAAVARVIDAAGMPYPNEEELAAKAALKAAYLARVRK